MKYISSDFTGANSSLSSASTVAASINESSAAISRYTQKLRFCKGEAVDLIKLRLDTYANALKSLANQVEQAATAGTGVNNKIVSLIDTDGEISDDKITDINDRIAELRKNLANYKTLAATNTDTTKDYSGYIANCETDISTLSTDLTTMQEKLNDIKAIDNAGGNVIGDICTAISKITINFSS